MPAEFFAVDNSVPEEVESSVKRLRSNRSREPSVIRTEHLRKFLEKVRDMETLDSKNWQKVVDLVHTEFWDIQLA